MKFKALFWKAAMPQSHSLTTDIGLLVLRIAFGGMMAFGHGWGKFSKVLKGDMSFGNPIGIGEGPSLVLAAGAEFLAAIALMVGFMTRFAAVPLIITMFVAAFIVHASDPFSSKEMALLYLSAYIAILLTGPGRFSVDKTLFK